MLSPKRLLTGYLIAVASAASIYWLSRPPDIDPEPLTDATAVASVVPTASAPAEAPAARALPAPAESAEPELASDPPNDLLPSSEEPSRPPPELDAKWSTPPRPTTLALVRRAREISPTLHAPAVREEHPRDLLDFVYDPPARVTLRRLKEALIAVIEARLDEAAAIADGQPLPASGLAPFFAAPFAVSENRGEAPYVRAAGWLEGRVFGVTFGIEGVGGYDDVLVLFERSGRRYRKAMVLAAHDHRSITDGLLGLDHVVRAVGGSYHVMTVNSSPWISSAWRGARLRIFEPTASPTQPRVLLDEPNSARIGETGADLLAQSTGFRAVFTSWNSLAERSRDVARTHVHQFVLTGERYRRVAPYAASTHDLPDEWLRLPWSEATELVAPASRDKLRAVHTRLGKAASSFDLRGPMELLTDQGQRQLRLSPRRNHGTITFVLAGEGNDTVIADVLDDAR